MIESDFFKTKKPNMFEA
jgi:hypothetical protein